MSERKTKVILGLIYDLERFTLEEITQAYNEKVYKIKQEEADPIIYKTLREKVDNCVLWYSRDSGEYILPIHLAPLNYKMLENKMRVEIKDTETLDYHLNMLNDMKKSTWSWMKGG